MKIIRSEMAETVRIKVILLLNFEKSFFKLLIITLLPQFDIRYRLL
jgi:hypothetical protein